MTASRSKAMALSFCQGWRESFGTENRPSMVVTARPVRRRAHAPLSAHPSRSSLFYYIPFVPRFCIPEASSQMIRDGESIGEASMVKAFLPTYHDGGTGGGTGGSTRSAMATSAPPMPWPVTLEISKQGRPRSAARLRKRANAIGILRGVHFGGHYDHSVSSPGRR